MELDFDKEIDALLRKESAAGTITISEFHDGLHLDADEIAAFAEKRVPPGVRKSLVSHFAACDRCRKILLNTAWLNNEQEEPVFAAAAVAPNIETIVPWYRRLFMFPNIAYVMGGLLVLFAGFIGLSVLTQSYMSGQSELSKVQNASQHSADPTPGSGALNANANLAPDNGSAANATAMNTSNMANAAAPSVSSANTMSNSSLSKRQEDRAADSESIEELQPRADSPAPPPPAARKIEALPVPTRRAQDLRVVPAPQRERNAEEDRMIPASKAPAATPAPKTGDIVRSDERERNAALAASEGVLRKDEKKALGKKEERSVPAGAGNTPATSRKYVNGRAFELKQGVWYDTNYSGQRTVNVWRRSKDYSNLDTGLRSIAESFSGSVVVTVWKGQAYRIQ